MKVYKAVNLNDGVRFRRKRDLEQVDATLNGMIRDGWTQEHVVSPNDFGGAIVGIFSKEEEAPEEE